MSYSRALKSLNKPARSHHYSSSPKAPTTLSIMFGMLFISGELLQTAQARSVESFQFSQEDYLYGVEHNHGESFGKDILHALIDECGPVENISYEDVIPYADPGSKHFIAQVQTKNHVFLNEAANYQKTVSFWRKNVTHTNATQEDCFILATKNLINKDVTNIGLGGAFLIAGIVLVSASSLPPVIIVCSRRLDRLAHPSENEQDIEMQPQRQIAQRQRQRRHQPRGNRNRVPVVREEQSMDDFVKNFVSLNEAALEAMGVNTNSGDYARYNCPITNQVMTDPYSTSNGNTYEYEAIKLWLSMHDSDPLTHEKLASKKLTPNHVLKNVIHEHIEELKARSAAPRMTH